MNRHSVRKFLAALSLMMGTGFVLTVGAQTQPTSTGSTSTSTSSSSTNSEDQTVKLEKYIVTGTNIPQAGDELSIPVDILSPQNIVTSGDATSTLDLLRKVVPSIGGVGVENATINTAVNYGGSSVNIHGLSVLVLVNGVRIASSAEEAVNVNDFVDLNQIPPAAVDHIEVLQDGGSAIYGSDAVGGVINIILKQDYNGWEATAHFGESNNDGHYAERTFSLTGGVSNGTTSITASASYSKTDPIMFIQRPYTHLYYANDYLSGVIDIYSLATGVDEDYLLNPKYNAPPGGGTYSIDQLVAMGYYIDAGNDAIGATEANLIPQVFNFATGQTLIESTKEANLTLNLTHKIFGDNLQYFGDFLYSDVKTQSQLNAQPLYPYLSDPYTDIWYNGGTPQPPEQYISYTTPTSPFSQAWIDQTGDFTSGYGVDVHARFIQYPRIFADDTVSTNYLNGFKGQIGNDYSWELTNNLSRQTVDYTNQNVIDTANFFTALANGSLNPFAYTQSPGVLPGHILGTASANLISTLSNTNFVFRGSPGEWMLPGGDVSFALGFNYFREVFNASADQLTIDKGWLNSPSILPINKSRDDLAYFGEVSIPVFGKDYNFPWAHVLNFDLAGRSDDYGGKVGSSRVPKVSLKYEPFNDQFSLRASWGKSFIAPQMYNLYGPVNYGSSQDVIYTPYGSSTPLPTLQFNSESGSNPALKPSTANTWTVGFGFTPAALKGFSLTFDYYSTHQQGLPGSADENTIVQSVEDLGAASPYVSYVHFGSPTGPEATAPGAISSHPKNTVWLDVPTVNVGGTWTKGFDVTAEYKLPTATAGKFDFRTTATVYTDFTYSDFPGHPYYSYLGDVTTTFNTVERYRTFSTIDWSYMGWEATINHTFLPSVESVGSGGASAVPGVHVSSYSQFDAEVAYTFKRVDLPFGSVLDGATVRLGLNNVFNVMPPVALNAETQTNADIGNYNGAVGRMGYIDLTYKF